MGGGAEAVEQATGRDGERLADHPVHPSQVISRGLDEAATWVCQRGGRRP